MMPTLVRYRRPNRHMELAEARERMARKKRESWDRMKASVAAKYTDRSTTP